MAKVIIAAEVEDSARWEAGFRSHVDLFQKMTVKPPIHFSTNDQNQVAILVDPEDLGAYMASLDDPETHEAMASDGVKRDTVKVYVLDKDLNW